MRRAVSLPTMLFVLVLALALVTHASTSEPQEERHHLHHQHLKHGDRAPSDAFFEVTDAALTAATTGCGLCQQSGRCDHAFKGSPGQFCLALASGLPCCCPQDAQCSASIYSCRCRRSYNSYTPSGGHPVKVVTHTSSTTTSEGTTSVSLFSLVSMLLCACCCYCCCCKRDGHDHHEHAPSYYQQQQAVYTAPAQYGAIDQTANKYAYAYPTAPPADPYNPAPYATPYATPAATGSGNAYASGALGAVAGLAGGMLIGSALGGGHRDDVPTTTTTTTYFDGDSGFGNATSNYDFAGDTGDYGGDDGGDFGGDS